MLKIKNNKILLFGYYGKSNIGDDIMLLNLVHLLEIRKPKKIIIIVDPSFNIENKFNKNIIFIRGFKNNLPLVIYHIIMSQIFIWGGGTCFFDNPSTRGLKELYFFTRLRKLVSNN